MSQDQGQQLVRHLPPVKPAHPGLGRPSLFAGMGDDDSCFDGETQRVRILSTLESARRPVRSVPSKKMRRDRRAATFSVSSKVLMAMMGIGVMALLTSFVIVVLNGHETSSKVEAAMQAQVKLPADLASDTPLAKTGQQPASVKSAASRGDASSNNPLAALIARSPVQPEPQAAVIENIQRTPAVSPAVPAATGKPATPMTSVAQASAPHVAKAGPVPVAKQLATETVAAKPVKTVRRNDNALRHDEDIALLEAMFAHAGSRKAPVSAAEEIKNRCGALSGPEAATCRASVCVQNPSASVCHPDQ